LERQGSHPRQRTVAIEGNGSRLHHGNSNSLLRGHLSLDIWAVSSRAQVVISSRQARDPQVPSTERSVGTMKIPRSARDDNGGLLAITHVCASLFVPEQTPITAVR